VGYLFKPFVFEKNNEFTMSEAQCDCMTSDIAVKEPNIINSQVLYKFNVDAPLYRIDKKNFVYLGNNSNIGLLNQSALDIAYHFKQPAYLDSVIASNKRPTSSANKFNLEKLIQLGVLTPNKDNPPTSEAAIILSAWLHITDHCNLRCDYCYLPHDKINMSLEIGKASIDSIFRSALKYNYKKVKIKFAGGEATLYLTLVTQLQQYAKTLSQQYAIEFDGVILSNGTALTHKAIQTILDAELRLMVSLDGIDEIQNRSRIYTSGKSTVHKVKENIEKCLRQGLIPDISVTISNKNVKGLPQLTEWLLLNNLPFSFNFYRENNLAKDTINLKLEEKNIIAALLASYKVIENNLPKRSLLGSLADRVNLSARHLRTCAVGRSYLVFDPKGQVSKCQMQSKAVTTYAAADPLSYIRNDQVGIQNISVEDKTGCKDCEWKYWCTGGCSLETKQKTGRYDVKSPNCKIYKAILPEVLRLEGLRLLKQDLKITVCTEL
jgi:uncharacterized protein